MLKDIKYKIENTQAGPIGIKDEYAVFIPLMYIDGELSILYEFRAKDMKVQPGEISFPGGGVKEGESYEKAAVRETVEELGIKEENIEVFGEIDYLVNGTRTIRCFVGTISGIDIKDMNLNPGEVDHVFTVPLKFLMEEEPDSYIINYERNMSREFPYNLIPNGRGYNWRDVRDKVYFYRYNDYTIWGFTARMTRNFIKIIREDS